MSCKVARKKVIEHTPVSIGIREVEDGVVIYSEHEGGSDSPSWILGAIHFDSEKGGLVLSLAGYHDEESPFDSVNEDGDSSSVVVVNTDYPERFFV